MLHSSLAFLLYTANSYQCEVHSQMFGKTSHKPVPWIIMIHTIPQIMFREKLNTQQWFGGFSSSECSVYLSQGQTQRPQHFERSVRFFSACLMSWLIWSMPSSTRFSCSETQTGTPHYVRLSFSVSMYSLYTRNLSYCLFCLSPLLIHFSEYIK